MSKNRVLKEIDDLITRMLNGQPKIGQHTRAFLDRIADRLRRDGRTQHDFVVDNYVLQQIEEDGEHYAKRVGWLDETIKQSDRIIDRLRTSRANILKQRDEANRQIERMSKQMAEQHAKLESMADTVETTLKGADPQSVTPSHVEKMGAERTEIRFSEREPLTRTVEYRCGWRASGHGILPSYCPNCGAGAVRIDGKVISSADLCVAKEPQPATVQSPEPSEQLYRRHPDGFRSTDGKEYVPITHSVVLSDRGHQAEIKTLQATIDSLRLTLAGANRVAQAYRDQIEHDEKIAENAPQNGDRPPSGDNTYRAQRDILNHGAYVTAIDAGGNAWALSVLKRENGTTESGRAIHLLVEVPEGFPTKQAKPLQLVDQLREMLQDGVRG